MPSSVQPPQEAQKPRIWLRVREEVEPAGVSMAVDTTSMELFWVSEKFDGAASGSP